MLVWSKDLHWEAYLRPKTVPEAIKVLEKFKGAAKIIAGGTDVLVQIRSGELSPRALVDVTGIPSLDKISLEKGWVRIGALVTHAQVAQSKLIGARGLALKEGASWLGSPQIRNIATVTGNLVSGQPGADTSVPLLALEGVVRVRNRKGERTIPLSEFFMESGKTAVDSSREMVTEISFPALKKGETSLSLRLARRKALALPILIVSIVLSADLGKKRFRYGRIALGPVSPIPFRARAAEALLANAPIEERLVHEVAERASRESSPRTSLLRGSEAYRRRMIAHLVERGIRTGIEHLEGRNG